MFLQSDFSERYEEWCEEELWEAFCDDNREAFSNLFLRFYEQLFRYGSSFSSNQNVVKDSIQKLFFRLWKKRKEICAPKSVKAYLYVSLRRILLRTKDRKTARCKRNSDYLDLDSENTYSIEARIILGEEKREREKILRNALHSLTPPQKEALLLRIDSGMSNSEIAEIMTVSEKRVRNLIYESKKRLKKEIYKLKE